MISSGSGSTNALAVPDGVAEAIQNGLEQASGGEWRDDVDKALADAGVARRGCKFILVGTLIYKVPSADSGSFLRAG